MREVTSPEIRGLLKIRWLDFDVRSRGVLAHLLGVARAGDHDAYRGVGDAKSDGRLPKRLDRTVNQETKLRGLRQFLSERFALEASRPDIFALESRLVGLSQF